MFHVRVLRSGVPQTEAYPLGGLPPGLPYQDLKPKAGQDGDRSGDQTDPTHLTTCNPYLYRFLHPSACRIPLAVTWSYLPHPKIGHTDGRLMHAN